MVPTLNSEPLIREFLESLGQQTILTEELEVLVLDGGSSDNTVEIAKSWGATIIPNPDVLAEPGVNLGLNMARGSLIMVLAVDNMFKQNNALEKIIRVFDDSSIYAAFPKHDSDSSDTIYSRYYNTFTDPFNHFVYGYAANARTFHREYKTLYRSEDFDIYDYASKRTRPMLALAQGFTLRAGYARLPSDTFDDCNPILEIIHADKKIAYVHSVSLYHHTIRDFAHFIRKQRWATGNSLRKEQFGISHRKPALSKGQQIRIRLWPAYAFSIIFPITRSIWGIIRDRELIWLLHPVVVLLSAGASTIETFSYIINSQSRVSRL